MTNIPILGSIAKGRMMQTAIKTRSNRPSSYQAVLKTEKRGDNHYKLMQILKKEIMLDSNNGSVWVSKSEGVTMERLWKSASFCAQMQIDRSIIWQKLKA